MTTVWSAGCAATKAATCVALAWRASSIAWSKCVLSTRMRAPLPWSRRSAQVAMRLSQVP